MQWDRERITRAFSQVCDADQRVHVVRVIDKYKQIGLDGFVAVGKLTTVADTILHLVEHHLLSPPP